MTLKIWADDLDEGTLEQATKTAALPIIHSHVALMADAHLGYGCAIGSVVPTKGAVTPSAAGYDVGCFHGDTRVPLLDGTHVESTGLTAIVDGFTEPTVTIQDELRNPYRTLSIAMLTPTQPITVELRGTPAHVDALMDAIVGLRAAMKGEAARDYR